MNIDIVSEPEAKEFEKKKDLMKSCKWILWHEFVTIFSFIKTCVSGPYSCEWTPG